MSLSSRLDTAHVGRQDALTVPGAKKATAVQRVRDDARRLERVESDLRAAVCRARDEGATWQELGDALGISRQAAQQRFGGGAR